MLESLKYDLLSNYFGKYQPVDYLKHTVYKNIINFFLRIQ